MFWPRETSSAVPILMEYEELKKLQVNAATDALTGLQNRRLFDEYCDKELTRAKRYGQPLAIVVLDLHKLKEVNDSHGHLQGDKVLQLAATTFGKTLRASDFAFRIGGDEFALLLPQTDTEQAAVLSNRVRAQFEADLSPAQPRRRSDARFRCGRASAGWRPKRPIDGDLLTSASISRSIPAALRHARCRLSLIRRPASRLLRRPPPPLLPPPSRATLPRPPASHRTSKVGARVARRDQGTRRAHRKRPDYCQGD